MTEEILDLEQTEVENRGRIDLYRPGLPASSVMGATLFRFLPASIVSLATTFGLLGIPQIATVGEMIGPMLAIAGSLTLGFGVGLAGLRRWLYPDAGLKGRRSILAGLLSPIAAFIAVTIGTGLTSLGALVTFGVLGIVMAVLMFFAWLSPTDAEMRPAPTKELETGSDNG